MRSAEDTAADDGASEHSDEAALFEDPTAHMALPYFAPEF